MKPALPPITLAGVCLRQLSLADQAKAAGFGLRHFYRTIRSGWAEWKMGQAESWCEACGVNLWDLRFNPKSVEWDIENKHDMNALAGLLKFVRGSGNPTKTACHKLATNLERARSITLYDLKEPEHREVLSSIIDLSGAEPTEERVEQLCRQMNANGHTQVKS